MTLLASCLCVTENRAAFAEWLIWNFDKQDYAARELVVVDSSTGPSVYEGLPNVRVVRAPPGTSVPAKRNLALDAARGELVAWFDDDDWQHPRRLSLLAAALAQRQVAGSTQSFFVDLRRETCAPYTLPTGPIFNGAGFRRAVIGDVRFQERHVKASDTPWVLAVRRRAQGRTALVPEILSFWLAHGSNLSNPAGTRALVRPLADVRAAVGAEAWADTDARLASLRAQVTGIAKPKAPPTPAPRLCVVVTTYDRPESLERLLDDLEREAPAGGIDVRVYDDASPGEAHVRALVEGRGHTYVCAAEHHGKEGWWRWWNAILGDLRQTDARWFVVLQDDLRLCRGFFARSGRLWDEIPGARKGTLFLHLDDSTVHTDRRWTSVRTRPAGAVAECGWVDCTAFVCERVAFDALGWRLERVPPTRWRSNRLLGSGVGAQLSQRLHRRGLAMYRVEESLAVHLDGPSRMNAEARRRAPMRTVRFVDGEEAALALAQPPPLVTASLASVPEREALLAQVVDALLPQVDALRVYLNGYASVPAFLERPKLVVATSAEHGDRGDAGKFFWCREATGYHLVCDDDLRYPPDYVRRLVAGIERHERRAVVGFHGAALPERVLDYYRSRRLLHFSQALAADTPVHVLGTGAAGYHTSAIALAPGDFGSNDMADIWFALAGQRQRVPFVSLAREAGWLTELPGARNGSIYARNVRRGPVSEATRAVQANAPWRLHGSTRVPSNGLVRVRVAGPTRTATLALPDRDHITLAVQRAGTYYERDLLDAIAARAAHGVFVDVGAHYGNHTVFFGIECGATTVVAVEPNPPAVEGLRANVAENGLDGIVDVRAIAVHPSVGAVELVALPWHGRAGSGATGNSGTVGVREARAGSIPAAPLDEILAGCTNVSVVKVDAEGLGAEILESGCETIARDRPLIAVEAASSAAFARVRALLAPLGYAPVGRYCWTPTWLWAAGALRRPRPRARARSAIAGTSRRAAGSAPRRTR